MGRGGRDARNLEAGGCRGTCMAGWYCKLAGNVSGPFGPEQLRALAANGRLSPQTEVRQGTAGPWMQLGQWAELTALIDAPTEPQAHTDSPAAVKPRAGAQASGQRAAVRRPPPTPRDRPGPPKRDQGPPKRVIIATGVGAGLVALLVLVSLLILLSRGCATGDGGGGGRSTGGKGAGSGTGFGDGSGPGAGDGPVQKAGAGADAKRAGTPRPDSSTQRKVGTNQSGSSATPGDGPPAPPPEAVTVRPLATAPSAAPGDSADEIGGGSGGGGSPGTSEFFGVKAKGTRFVYIVDCSSSMSGPPFQKACAELIASIEDLTPRQQFFVMFFASSTFAQFHPAEENELIRASKANKERLQEWVKSRAPGGGTYPGDALIRGLDLKPDAIFLLTDGAFSSAIVDKVRDYNKKRIIIHAIAFTNLSGAPLLQQIAKENNGTYRFVP